MFCQFCGVQLQPNVKFCHACGKKVEPFLPPQPIVPPVATELPPSSQVAETPAMVMESEENSASVEEAVEVPAEAPATEAVAAAPSAVAETTPPAAMPQSAPTFVAPAPPAYVPPQPPTGFAPPPAQSWAPVPPPGFVPPPTSAPRKTGSHKVSIAIMAVLFIIGLGVYTLTQFFPPYAPQAIQEEIRSETPWFYVEDGELYFDSESYEGPAEITVPSEVDGQTVTALAEDCFAGNDNITTVILPDTLQVIGPEAFADCTALRGIYIPDNVTVIGAGAFRGCTNLEAIDLPGTIESIGDQAFEDCENLEHIFFDGKKSQWKDLYTDKIGPNTQVYCTNGTLKQGRGK